MSTESEPELTPELAREIAAGLHDDPGDIPCHAGLVRHVLPAVYSTWIDTGSDTPEEVAAASALTDALLLWASMSDPTAAAPVPASNPQHYRETAVEPIDAIEAWGLSYNLGNVVKYLARAGRKGSDTRAADLRKAADYLHREIHGTWPWEKEQPAP